MSKFFERHDGIAVVLIAVVAVAVMCAINLSIHYYRVSSITPELPEAELINAAYAAVEKYPPEKELPENYTIEVLDTEGAHVRCQINDADGYYWASMEFDYHMEWR